LTSLALPGQHPLILRASWNDVNKRLMEVMRLMRR